MHMFDDMPAREIMMSPRIVGSTVGNEN